MRCDKKLPRLDCKGLIVLGIIAVFIIAAFIFVRVIAFKGVLPAHTSPSEFYNGILGSYYCKSKPADEYIRLMRIDKKIAFDWKLDSPDQSIGTDNFSVVWSGFISPPASGEYVFKVYSDDGVRLYVDSVELIDRWEPVNLEVTAAKDRIYLEKGKFYPLRLEYKELYINATVYLFWEAEDVELSVVPENCYYVKREIYNKYKEPVYKE